MIGCEDGLRNVSGGALNSTQTKPNLKARDLWHGLAATVDSRTDRARGVLFTDSNLPTNDTRFRSSSSSFHDVVEMSSSRIQVLRWRRQLYTHRRTYALRHRCKRRCL